MVNIDINIPVDRRTAIAAGAGLVAVVGGLAYCALRPSVKVVCAESIVPAMRAVGDKCPFSLSVIPVADGDCTADKVSSLASSRGADAIIWKNNAPFEDLDGSGLGNLQSIATDISAGLSYAVNTQAEIKSLAICADAPVAVFNDELLKVMNGELLGDLRQFALMCRDLRDRYPAGVFGIEDSEADSWGLAACIDYFAAASPDVDLTTLQVTDGAPDEAGEGDDSDGGSTSPFSEFPLRYHFIHVDDKASQSPAALESGFKEGAYPVALMRFSSYASLKASGISCDAVQLWGTDDITRPVLYPAYSVSAPSTVSAAATNFIKWLLGANGQGVLCGSVDYVPAGRGAEISGPAKDLFGTVLDAGEGQSVEGGASDQPTLVYAAPSWMSKLSVTSRERYMEDARKTLAS